MKAAIRRLSQSHGPRKASRYLAIGKDEFSGGLRNLQMHLSARSQWPLLDCTALYPRLRLTRSSFSRAQPASTTRRSCNAPQVPSQDPSHPGCGRNHGKRLSIRYGRYFGTGGSKRFEGTGGVRPHLPLLLCSARCRTCAPVPFVSCVRFSSDAGNGTPLEERNLLASISSVFRLFSFSEQDAFSHMGEYARGLAQCSSVCFCSLISSTNRAFPPGAPP